MAGCEPAESLLNLITKNQYNPAFGKLMLLPDPYIPSITHYAVQINSELSLSWCQIEETKLYGKGKIHRWDMQNPAIVPAPIGENEHIQSREEILAALIKAVNIFHLKWDYNIATFNCEHWSRLIVQGKAICHQITSGISSLSNADNSHLSALAEIAQRIAINEDAQNALSNYPS